MQTIGREKVSTQRPQGIRHRARTFDEGLLERRRPDGLGLALDGLPALPGGDDGLRDLLLGGADGVRAVRVLCKRHPCMLFGVQNAECAVCERAVVSAVWRRRQGMSGTSKEGKGAEGCISREEEDGELETDLAGGCPDIHNV